MVRWIRSYSIITTFLIITAIPLKIIAESSEALENTRIPTEDVQRFSDAIANIKKYYVKPISDKELFDNAIRGMLSGLDPHSGYLDEKDFKELQSITNGEFGGLGIEVSMDGGVIKVITPLLDTPAFKAGIKPGDYIVKLGKKSLQGLELNDAVEMMRGKPGSAVNITILRKGVDKPLNFTLLREKIQIKSVKSNLFDQNYAYVRLSQFQSQTDTDMEKAVAALKLKAGGKLKGLILDLRNNPGGLLDSAIKVSDAFLDKDKKGKSEMIVYTQGRLPGSKFTAMATGDHDIIDGAPMVVLINNGSASASEIVAGALKDNRRAIIIGTRSFGKGSVQTVLPLDDKRGIKLTTALYFTPMGTSIQAKGISPDIIVQEVDMSKSHDKSDLNNEISEVELSGHIVNAQVDPASQLNHRSVADDQRLLHEDYQLYTALTILEGLAIAHG